MLKTRRGFFATLAALFIGAKAAPAALDFSRDAFTLRASEFDAQFPTLDLGEFHRRYLQPAAQQIANQIDNEVLGIKPPGFPDNYRWYPEDLEEEDLHG